MKYIVYLTTNIINNKIYVGVRETENPDVFDGYIGCGVLINSPSTYKKSKTAFQYAVNKYGPKNFRRITLAVCDNEDDAYFLESIIVNERFIRRPDVYNMTVGGHKGPDQSIEIYQYSIDGKFIKKYSSAKSASRVLKCSRTAIDRAAKNMGSSCGFLWSYEFHEKIDIGEYKANFRKLSKIYEYNEDGTYSSEYNNTSDVISKYGCTLAHLNTSILLKSKCCGKYFSTEKVDIFELTEVVNRRGCKVYLYNKDGSFFMEFNNSTECANFFGNKCAGHISKAYRLKRLYCGYQVSYDKVESMSCIEIADIKKPVLQYDLNGKLVKRFDTMSAAIKEYGLGVKKVCKGIQNQTKGYIFKIES